MVYIGWIGQQRGIGGVQALTEEAMGLLMRSVAWCLDDIEDGWKLYPITGEDYDWLTDTIGAQPADITVSSGTLGLVQRERGVFSSRRMLQGASSGVNHFFNYTNSGNADKHDVYCFFLRGNTSSDFFQIFTKGFRYYVNLQNSNTQGLIVSVRRTPAVVLSASINLGLTEYPLAAFRMIWVRFRSWDVGASTELQVKVWRGRAIDEPSSWLIDITDNTHTGQTGTVATQFNYGGGSFNGVAILSPLAGILAAPPDTPVVTVTEVTGSNARVTGSAYNSEEGATHVSTEYWIRLASDDSIVMNLVTTDVDFLLTKRFGPLPDETEMYAQMAYTDSNDKVSEIGQSANFTTLAFDGCTKTGSFDPDADSELTMAGYLGGTPPWANFSSVGNPLDGLAIAHRYGVLNKPRILLLNTCLDHDEAQGRVKGGFDGEFAISYYPWYGMLGNRFQGIEWSQLGVALITKGELGSSTDPFSGFIGWLNIGVPLPFGRTVDGRLSLSGCDGMGVAYPGTAYVKIDVWENNVLVSSVSETIATDKRPGAVHRTCGLFPFYHLYFKATKDYTADPDGKTWDLQLAFLEDEDPDGSEWDIEHTWESEVIVCGKGGPAIQLVPGATGGASGAVFFTDIEVENLGEYCGNEDEITGETPASDPEVFACSTCAEIRGDATGWSGPGVTESTEARWIIRLVSDDSILYDTDWQTEFIETFTKNVFDLAAYVSAGQVVYMTVQLRDEDLTTSAVVSSDNFVIGGPPETPTLTLVAQFINKVRLSTSAYSSPSGRVHEVTQLAIFAGDDDEMLTPLETFEYSLDDGDQLEGEFELMYDFDTSLSYKYRVIFTDEDGCSSTVGTEFLASGVGDIPGDADEPIVQSTTPIVCPIWDETCEEAVENDWTDCPVGEDVEWESPPNC
jgi:hypothetical protein